MPSQTTEPPAQSSIPERQKLKFPGFSADCLKKVHWNLEISDAIVFGGRKLPGPHVDLHGGNDELRHLERGVAPLAHGDENLFAPAFMDVNVFRPLGADRGFPYEGVPPRRLVVVT